jgi:acylpyruvate hydrolase
LQPVSSDDIAFSPSNSQDIPDFVRYGKKVIGIGRNYRWKNSELAKVLKVPDEPIVFMKPSTSYIVEGQDIEVMAKCYI